MHKNWLWLCLLCLVFGFTFYMTTRAVQEYWKYYTYSQNVEAPIGSMRVYPHDGKYFLELSLLVDRELLCTKQLTSKPFQNEWAANNYKKHLEGVGSWTVWAKKGASKTCDIQLNRTFPWKRVVYTLVVWIILIYFIWLGFYVTKLTSRE